MFKLGDKVRLTTKTIGNIDYYDLYDEIGTITHIEYSMPDIFITALFKDTYIKALETFFKLAEPQLIEIQERKEQLARDLFTLIETYEKTTNTHVTQLLLRRATYQSDSKTIDRVIGVRLEVQL